MPALDAETRRTIDLAAKKAADAAVKKTLLSLGIDAVTPEGMLEQQQNQAFLTKLRTTADSRATKYWAAGIGTVFSIIGAIIVFIFQHWITGGTGE